MKSNLRKKIAQMLLIRQYDILQKTEVDENIARSDKEIETLLSQNQFGGMWIMGNQKLNVVNMSGQNWGGYKPSSKEYAEFVTKLNAGLEVPLLCGIDAENGGGDVFNDLNNIVSAFAVGAANDEQLAYDIGASVAKEIKSAGANWRWTPVVDIAGHFNSERLGRAFSCNKEQLIRMSIANIKGMQDNGVAATAKHFPGCDPNEYRDTHITVTRINTSLGDWKENQGDVFQRMIDCGVYSIMIAHTAFPAADNTKVNGKYLPATLSKKIVTELLKNEMGFGGVVITDALNMGGLNGYYSYEKMIVELVNAGNDVLLGVNDFATLDIIEDAVKNGEISEDRINDAYSRIMEMKRKLGLLEKDFAISELNKTDIEKTREINKKISEKAMTLVCNRKKLIPIDERKIHNIAVICSVHSDDMYEKMKYIVKVLEKYGKRVHIQRRLKSREELKDISNKNDLIIYCTYLGTHRPMGLPSFYGEEFSTFINALSYGAEKSIGVSLGNPNIHQDFLENCDSFVNTYGYDKISIDLFVKAIFGEIEMNGIMPV